MVVSGTLWYILSQSGRPSFSDVAGLEKHIQLFKELVLYPLDEENVTGI